MNKKLLLSLSLAAISLTGAYAADDSFRAPAYPLITIDPYTSAWSMSDNLYDQEVRHWTESAYPLIGVVTVDSFPGH